MEKEKLLFAYQWGRNGGNANDILPMMRVARTILRGATAECNGAPLPRGYKSAVAQAYGIAKRNGFSVTLGGDPRGYTTKIVFPNGAFNTWGGKEEGWGVPTS